MLILNQNAAELREKKYGKAQLGKCGCEAIAAYNALEFLGMGIAFDEVISAFENRFSRGGGFLAGGRLGATPADITAFLRSRGLKPKGGRLGKMQSIKEPGIFILSYWNKPFTKGIHTVAIDFDGEKYTAANYLVKLCTKGDLTDFLPDKKHYFYCTYIPKKQ